MKPTKFTEDLDAARARMLAQEALQVKPGYSFDLHRLFPWIKIDGDKKSDDTSVGREVLFDDEVPVEKQEE